MFNPAHSQKPDLTGAWDEAFLDVAERLAAMSKCQSNKVCALAVRNNRIIATGLNGTLPGEVNCCERFPYGVTPVNRTEHYEWALINERHAEDSMIREARDNGVSLIGCTVYVNLQPCRQCADKLILAQVGRVVYRRAYDKCDVSITADLLLKAGISLHQAKPSNDC
jgi:dCMP deaminase